MDNDMTINQTDKFIQIEYNLDLGEVINLFVDWPNLDYIYTPARQWRRNEHLQHIELTKKQCVGGFVLDKNTDYFQTIDYEFPDAQTAYQHFRNFIGTEVITTPTVMWIWAHVKKKIEDGYCSFEVPIPLHKPIPSHEEQEQMLQQFEVDNVRNGGYKLPDKPKQSESVNHPKHYNLHPSGIECITIVQHMNFCCGNAMKYIWRAGLKDCKTEVEDLKKAIWYLEAEIKRLEKQPEEPEQNIGETIREVIQSTI